MKPLRIATAVVGGWAGVGVFVLLVVHVPVVAGLLATHLAALALGYGLGRPARMELHMCHLQLDKERAAAAVIEGAVAIEPERPQPSPKCESCFQPADVQLKDGTWWCRECDGSARRLGYDLDEDPEPPAWVLDPPYLQDDERGVGA